MSKKDAEEPKMLLVREKSYCKKATHCIILTIWHSGESNNIETIRFVVETGSERQEGINRWSTGYAYDSESILFDTVKVDAYHYTFVKTHTMRTKRVNHNEIQGV